MALCRHFDGQDRARLKEVHEKLERAGLEPREEAAIRDLHLGRKLMMEGSLILRATWLRYGLINGIVPNRLQPGPLQVRFQEKHTEVHAVLLSDLLLLTQPKDGKLLLKVPPLPRSYGSLSHTSYCLLISHG